MYFNSIYLVILDEDNAFNIAEAGALIRSAADEVPICNSEEHKEIGLDERCDKPVCGSEEYKAIGIEQECRPPVCGSEQHQINGLETNCLNAVCNSPDHEIIGLDKPCEPICDSEEHKAIGLDKNCRKAINEDTFQLGSSIANAWMYDGDTWNRIKPMSKPRERLACSLVQTNEGVTNALFIPEAY